MDFSSTQGGGQWDYLSSSNVGGENGTNLTYGVSGYPTWWTDWAANPWLYVSDTQQHPGNAFDSIRRWTAPYAGTVTILGTSRMTSPYPGDGAYIRISKGTITGTLGSQTQLYQGFVASADTVGVAWSLTTTVAPDDVIDTVVNRNGAYDNDEQTLQQSIAYTQMEGGGWPNHILTSLSQGQAKLGDSVAAYGHGFRRDAIAVYSGLPLPVSPRMPMPTTFVNSTTLRFTVQGPKVYADGSWDNPIFVWIENHGDSLGPSPLVIPPPLCAPSSVTACSPAAGVCGRQTCAADGNSFGACTQISCGVCTPGAKQNCDYRGCPVGEQTCNDNGSGFGACTDPTYRCAFCTPGAKKSCDYRGSAGTSHCALGEQTCNGDGSRFGTCTDPTYQCGTWSSIDFRECAFTGVAKHAGVLADIPSGDSKQAYVLHHKATVSGVPMYARAYSWDLWGNSWGTFAVSNSGCFVYNLSYWKTCSSPFSGSILYMDPSTGRTFREGTGFPCTGECFGGKERRVYSSEPRWGNEPFLPGGFGGPPRCETIVGKTFEW